MSVLLGYHTFGNEVFMDDSVSLRGVKYTEFSSAILDEININSKTNQGMSNVRSDWENSSIILAKFVNTLEAGNVDQSGVKITKFKIVRRLSNQQQNEDVYLGEIPFSALEGDLSFTDSTQPNSDLIYTIIPVGENSLDGTPQEVSISSNFTGVWIVDKDTNEVLVFDKALGQIGNVESTLNHNRTQIDTFSKYPQFYYGEQEFETFTLSTVILPENKERTGNMYKNILKKFINEHTPKIVKTDTGRILVADISNVRTSTPLNTWSGHDYIQLQVDVTECADYEEFMKGE